jgi:hypothetical protein
MSVLSFVTRLMAIKSKFAFSNNFYKELLKLISVVLPANHKLPRDMYQSNKLLFMVLVWIMRGLMFAKIIACFSRRSI